MNKLIIYVFHIILSTILFSRRKSLLNMWWTFLCRFKLSQKILPRFWLLTYIFIWIFRTFITIFFIFIIIIWIWKIAFTSLSVIVISMSLYWLHWCWTAKSIIIIAIACNIIAIMPFIFFLWFLLSRVLTIWAYRNIVV